MQPPNNGKVVSLSGDPVEHYRDGPTTFEPPRGEPALDAITQHITQYLGPIDGLFHELISDAVHIDVHHVAPNKLRPYHTLVTSGMSDLPMNVPASTDVPRHVELMVTLPPAWRVDQDAFADDNWYWPVRQLKTLARFPHKYDTWIGAGHTVTNGDPMQPLAACTALCGAIFLPPLAVPEAFKQLRVSDGKTVHFLAVVPLYEEEMALKLRDGANALIERLRKHGVTDMIAPTRRNVGRKVFGLF
jgi:hypothetical protein